MPREANGEPYRMRWRHDFRRYLDRVAVEAPPTGKGLSDRREWLNRIGPMFDSCYPALRSKFDISIPAGEQTLPVRLYLPVGIGPRPLVLFCHGGGWVAGSIISHDFQAASIAAATSSIVASLDYRLAPECPYPAAVDDCCHALDWLVRHGDILGFDATRIGALGDSAGAQIIVAAAMRAVRSGAYPFRLLALLYPALDDRKLSTSYREFQDNPLLSAADMAGFWSAYLSGRAADEIAAPGRANDLSYLPPTIVLTAEIDPLRDEGEDFAARLRTQGVDVRARRAIGLGHGFMRARPVCHSVQMEFDWLCGEIIDLFARDRRGSASLSS